MNSRNPAILCIDDEELNLKLLEAMLLRNGFQVVCAPSGMDALLKIKSQTIDLIILDLAMPGMDGIEVCRKVKEDQKLGDIPIIMITGFASHEARVRGIEVGVEDYFTKPLDKVALLARINILLKAKKLSDERKRQEKALKQSHDELDCQVKLQTTELAKANEMLREDIAKRKWAEQALQESEEKYRTILEVTQEGYFENDLAGNIIFVNGAMCIILGYTREELIEKNYRQLTDDTTCKETYHVYNEIYRTGEPAKEIEWQIVRKDGTRRYLEVSISLEKNSLGKPIGFRAIARDITERKRVAEKLQNTLNSLRKAVGMTIQVLVSAVETRDPYTAGHQRRVADLARAIATEMGLPQEKIDGIRMAGSIHDIGKLSIPSEILTKPTKLSELEFLMIKEHAAKGYEILKDVESPWSLAEIVYQHHERMDGSGYPNKLQGKEILIEARILCVADVVEAMASDRPYRPSLGIDVALNEIEKNRGIFYDDTVADACLRIFQERGFKLAGIYYE